MKAAEKPAGAEPGASFWRGIRTDFGEGDMEIRVTTPAGQLFGLLTERKRVSPVPCVEFYEWLPDFKGWRSLGLRLAPWSKVKNAVLNATWPPMFIRSMVATDDGFEVEFTSNNWDPPDHRWRAVYSARTRRFTLIRGLEVP